MNSSLSRASEQNSVELPSRTRTSRPRHVLFFTTGTPAFQCPEIANGDDTYSGFCIDIWSCGVTLFNLVTGQLPFEADNIYLLFQTIGAGVYNVPGDVEPHLASLIRGLLHVNKDLRFTIEQIKQHDWFRRRPPRTFDYLPFPPLALRRFQSFTMLDYLTELHQPSALTDDDRQSQAGHGAQRSDGHIAVLQPSSENRPETAFQRERPSRRRKRRSKLNCGCSRTTSSDEIHRSTNHTRDNHRLCSIS